MAVLQHPRTRAAARPRQRRARAWAVRLAGQAAETAGRTVRVGKSHGPGTAGPLLVAYGLYLAWPPLGFIAAGVFLLLLDRRAP